MTYKFVVKSDESAPRKSLHIELYSVKVYRDFFLPEFSLTKIVTYRFHVDESTERKYGMIMIIYLLISLVINVKLSKNVVEVGKVP